MLKPKNIVEPVIKWSGSKRYVAPELSKYISIQKRYIEPFIGGGAMLPFRQIPNALASDILWRSPPDNCIPLSPTNVS